MKQERLNLYQIDMKYVRNLHHKDDRVYIGIVVVAMIENTLFRYHIL